MNSNNRFGIIDLRRVTFVAWMACASAAFGILAPSMTYYVPFPEEDALTALDSINAAALSPITTYVSIAAISDGTIIYYDQWEDDYEKTHHLAAPIQSTTQIWGDGNPANGAPPGITNDIIKAGSVILLYNTVDPADPYALDYDSRDKIVSTRAIAVTRTYWAAGSGTLMAGSVETFDTAKWGTDYRVPVGQDIPDGTAANDGDHQMFEYTALSIMAAEDGTVVMVDADANGTFETTNTVNEGECTFVNGGVNVGARVVSTKPIQVLMFTGDVGSNYESRDSTLLPVSQWSNSYFAPVATASGNGTRVWLYNPSASSITVNYRYRVGSSTAVTTNSTTVVAADSYASVLLTDGSGTQFYTTGSPAPVFYAYSTTDSDTATTSDNQAYDWSYTLIPKQLLTPQVLVGLGIGRDPTSATNPNEDGNPIWVTTVGNGQSNATVFVDYDGDNVGSYTDANGHHYDTNYVARELQPIMIYDPDGDQTAMLIYVLSTNTMLAAAWGQDPTTATAGAPGLDAGTAVPPVDVFDVSKSLTLVNDSDHDGQLGPGERVSYEINIGNTSRAPIPADVVVKDVLPADTTYVTNSTAYRTSTNGSWVVIADDSSGTAFPLDGSGFRILAAIPVDNFFTVRFQADVDAYANLTPGRASIINTGSVTAVVYNRTLPFMNDTYLHGSLGDRVWTDANGNGVQDAGEVGINGVLVYLDSNTNGTRDANERYSITSGDGNYLLTNALIEAGTHLVRVDRLTLASDYVATYDLDGVGTPDEASVVLAAGQDRTDVDFGYQIRARLGDFVWVDSNANGVQDGGELGLSNVVVRLYSTNDVVLATVTSSVAGAYLFTGVTSGTYTVGFTPPSGYLFTASNVGGNDTVDSDPLAGTNRTAAITLIGSQTNLNVDAGFYLPASISGSVNVDVNGNGVIDAEDTVGIDGVTVRLLDGASNVVATATTSGTGDFTFANVTPGSYMIVQTLPNGYSNTLDVAAPNDLRIPRTLTSSQNSTGNDFYDTISIADLRNKVLYLSDPSQSMDRVNPGAAGDNTTAQSAILSNSVSSGYATIGVANVSTGVTTDVTSLTPITCVVPHTVFAAGSSRLMIVGVSENISAAGGTDGRITGATYGSANLVGIGGVTNGDQIVAMFALVNPPVGTNSVVVNFSSAPQQYAVVGVATFTNVNQTTPYGAFYSSTGATGNPSLTLASAAGELVLDTVSLQSTILSAVGSGQTRRWTLQSPDNGGTANGGGSTKVGAASVTMTWTSTSGANPWSMGAISLKPAPLAGIGNSTTFTQVPAFASSFLLPAGTVVQITNYIAVVSGSMPTNPSIVASLAYGGSPFLTVSNPVYRAASSSLTWRATIPATVTIPSGSALTLTVASAQTGTTFRINYDSATFPSKIVLPTTTVIDVPSLGVYDAAYPGGSLVASSTVTAVRYVRVTVTDPFGAYDVTGVDLTIDGPGTGSDLNASLGQAQVVASNTVSKTYEYPWQTTLTPGTYTLTTTAHEGSEGIVATAATTEILVPMITSVGDFVWVDSNGNGQQDGGEPGLSNVVVRLYNSNSVVVASTTSTVSGAYFFTSLPVGSYSVGFTPPAGYLFTTSNVGSDASDSDPLAGTNRTAAVALIGSQTNLTIDAGFYLPATLTGSVRVDQNGNGIVEAGDTNGIAGVTVQLLNAASNVVATTTTAAGGVYSFTNVFPGAYTVREIDLGGWYSTTDVSLPNDNLIPVTLTSGQSSSNNTFYDTAYATIGDFVWVDTDGDGQQDDGGGSGLSNVVARLYGTNNTVIATTTSTVSGAYTFTGLTPGMYTVGFTPPAGYLFTTSNVGSDASDSDPLTGTNRTAAVTLVSGQTDSSIDAGFYAAASVSGFVRVDQNGNGIVEAGDTNGIVAVTVQLLGVSSNVVATTTTAAGGAYSFTGLFPGAYTVREIDLGGWNSTTDVSLPNDNLIPVTLVSGQSSAGNSFYDASYASIGNFVWVDANGNGQQDDGAGSGLSNVVVRLYDTNSLILATVTSSVSGAYAFTNLAAGNYTVGFTPPAGYLFTTSNVGSDASDSDPLTGTNRTASVTLVSGQTDSSIDAGFYQGATISGFVRVDQNGNGIVEAGDTNGIAGVTVQLLNGASNVIVTATTGVNGGYSFTNIMPGAYFVKETDLSGYYSTIQSGGGTNNLIAVTTVSGIPSTGNNFYDAAYAQINGLVWYDRDANGTVNLGELSFTNVLVYLDANSNGVADVGEAQRRTDVNGGYSFSGLLSGTYLVRVDTNALPAGFAPTYDFDGTNTLNLARVSIVDLVTVSNVNFGYRGYGVLGDRVFMDANANGRWDDGEGLPGVEVTVVGDTDGNGAAETIIVTTATDGLWTVPGLRSTTNGVPYMVTVDTLDLPVGLTQNTVDPDGGSDSTATVSLTDAEPTRLDQDFGYRGTGWLGDLVWVDLDANGVQGSGEPGVSNVAVNLTWAGPDGNVTTTNDNTDFTTVTDANGAYNFAGLPVGNFRVAINAGTLPVGLAPTYDVDGTGTLHVASLSLAANQARTDVDFGYRGAGTLGDRIFEDINGNGHWDVGEGIPGVGVTVSGDFNGDGDTESATVTTGAEGLWTVSGLRTSTNGVSYTVSVVVGDLPDGLNQNTADPDGGGNSTANVTLTHAAPVRLDMDFGYRGIGTIGDRVWVDYNGDGVQGPGEPGISNVTVRLTWAGADGNFATTNDNSVYTNVTGVSGNYSFTSLPAGEFRVETVSSTVPSTLVPSYDLDGVDSPHVADLTLALGETLNDVDFGYRGTGWIGDRVWVDLDGDGVQDIDEPGIQGVTVNLTWAGPDGNGATTNDNVVLTTATDGSGMYSFDGLPSGTYRVATQSATLPAGFSPTYDLDGTGTLHTASLTLALGQTRTDADFGYRGAGSVGDRIFVDANSNGVWNAGEGVSNVHVTVSGDFNGDGSSESVIVTSGSDGLWTSVGLLAPPAGGTYTIAVATADLPANARANTVDPDGGNDSVASVTLTPSNANRLDQDFGYQNAGRIAGQVRLDEDVDGALADLDEGLPGVLITLYTDPNSDGNPVDGTPVATHVTDTNGLYAFEGLLPGAYVVVEADPAGATSTADVSGANDNRVPVVLASGGAVTGRDFLDAFPLRKTVDKALAVRDEILTYTITPELSIDTLLQAVSVTDTVPVGSDLYLSTISPNANGQVAGRTVTWALGSNQAGVSGAVTGSPAQSGTLVLTNTADTYIRQDAATTSYGTSTTLSIQARNNQNRHALVQFDLSSIPAGAVVTQATLRAVVSAAGATDANVYRLSTLWGETSATWNRPLGGTTVWAGGGAFSASDYTAGSLGLMSLRTTGAKTLDVTATVNGWVVNGGNRGFVLIGTANRVIAAIHSREATTPANRPTLTVNWSIPKKPATTTVLHVPTALVAGTNQPVTVTMSVTTDTIITNVTPPAALGWTATGGATGVRLQGPTPSGPLTLPVGTTAFTYVYNLSSGTNAGSVTFSGAPAGTNFFATATANSVLVSPPLTLQVRVTSTNAPVVNMATLTTATLFSQGVNSPLVTTELRRVNISGAVFLDTNGDHAFGGDTAVPGVTVQLWSDPNADGSPADGAVVASTLTGGDGSYLFASVLAGTHFVVVETDPANATSVADTQGALTDNRIAVYPQTVDLSGNNFLDNAAVYSIAGEVRDDVDLNGVFTNPDRPVGNVTVRLFTDPNGDGDPSDGQVFASTVTSMNGAYLFERVPNGSYVVIEIDPQGATSTGDTYGQNDNRVKVNVTGADSIDNDFLDEVDPGGYLYDTTDGRIVSGGSIAVTGPGVATIMMTGTNGQYMFITDGTPGDYTVAITPPPGYVIDPTRAPAGPVYDPTNGPLLVVLGSGESTNTLGYLVDSTAVANPFYYTFHLEPGDPIILNNNYPLVRLPSLGDRVWLDRNGNGLQDVGESGISNVTVRLLGAVTNNVLGTTVTDALGGYGFANLTSGTYYVEFVAPAGAVFTAYHAGTNTLDSDALRTTGRSAAMVLALGNNRTDVDAGLYVPALLYGYAFLDSNTNLVRDVVAGDTAMPNMSVSLWTNGVMLASTNTSLTGYYEFARLVPATYEVRMLCTPSLIVAVPTAEPAASNPERNRAVPVSNYGDAFYTIVSGHAISPNAGEPVNFGFTSPPLSTAMGLSVYVSADGVMLELCTSNESGYDDIVIYAWLSNAWVEVGRVLSADVWGEGSNLYTVKAHGLSADGAYYFMIVDEAGHEHFTGAPVAVQSIRVEAAQLDMQTLTLTFNTEMNSSYAIKVSTDLVHWTSEYASYPTAKGWSDYVNTPFTVIGTRIQVRVPANRAKAFFKIERVNE